MAPQEALAVSEIKKKGRETELDAEDCFNTEILNTLLGL